MRRFWRFVASTFYLGFLTAIGAAVFVYVRHTPRSTITGPLHFVEIAPDGSRLLTLRTNDWDDKSGLCGPLQVWDTHRGMVVREMMTDLGRFHPLGLVHGPILAIFKGDKMNTATGREEFRALNCGRLLNWLAEDGRTLVTIDLPMESDPVTIIRIWDVPPTRAFRWSVAVVASLAALCFTASRLFRRRRQLTGPKAS